MEDSTYLVPYKHDDDIGLSVVPQLFEPAFYVLECHLLGDVVHKQSTHGSSTTDSNTERKR